MIVGEFKVYKNKVPLLLIDGLKRGLKELERRWFFKLRSGVKLK